MICVMLFYGGVFSPDPDFNVYRGLVIWNGMKQRQYGLVQFFMFRDILRKQQKMGKNWQLASQSGGICTSLYWCHEIRHYQNNLPHMFVREIT